MAKCLGKNCTIIKKLLDANALDCQSCKKLLQLPVSFVDGLGIVCENCRLKNVGCKSTRIEMFNLLLPEMIIPCANASVGCNEEIQYEHMEEHLKLCKYRPVKCPHQECAWMECQDKLFDHFVESHKEDVIECETFDFDVDLQKESVYFAKLLIQTELKFLFIFQQVKVPTKATLYEPFLMLHLYALPKIVTISPTYKMFSNISKTEWSRETKMNLLNLIDQGDGRFREKINLGAIKTLFGEDNLKLNVNIKCGKKVRRPGQKTDLATSTAPKKQKMDPFLALPMKHFLE